MILSKNKGLGPKLTQGGPKLQFFDDFVKNWSLRVGVNPDFLMILSNIVLGSSRSS